MEKQLGNEVQPSEVFWAGKVLARWHDLLRNQNNQVFPLGTGPKPHEIWHDGYYPVAWTNRHYRMVYHNMGHNDMDYKHGTNRPLSSTFSSPPQNQFILQSLQWLGTGRRP